MARSWSKDRNRTLARRAKAEAAQDALQTAYEGGYLDRRGPRPDFSFQAARFLRWRKRRKLPKTGG